MDHRALRRHRAGQPLRTLARRHLVGRALRRLPASDPDGRTSRAVPRLRCEVEPVAVAVMAKVPGATPVKSRLHPALTPDRATELYRCFLLDRLDALARLPGIEPVV